MRQIAATVSLSREQARFLGLFVTRVKGVASIDLFDDRRPTPLRAVPYDKTGYKLGEHNLDEDNLVLP